MKTHHKTQPTKSSAHTPETWKLQNTQDFKKIKNKNNTNLY